MNKESLRESIEEHFGKIPDPRVVTRSSHKLVDIIAIAILAILCGADRWFAIETYGKAKEEWLSTFLELPNAIPSHDTFGRIFSQKKAEDAALQGHSRRSFCVWKRLEPPPNHFRLKEVEACTKGGRPKARVILLRECLKGEALVS
ncbi:MAG: transposase family protein [Hydrococcus sp. CSU_1_8]|nr:transposase family protein [Hydrococcus sp. CSU_1_8]